MLFRRRHPASLWERIRIGLWPRRSFSRSFRYMGKRIVRISASPHAIALGLSIGVCAAFTPFFGFHIILAVLVAWACSANIAAAAIGTALSNPLTVPFIFGMTYALGQMLFNIGEPREPISVAEFLQMLEDRNFADLWEVFIQLLLGAAVLGAAAGLLTYLVALNATWRFRQARAAKLRAHRRLHPHQPKAEEK